VSNAQKLSVTWPHSGPHISPSSPSPEHPPALSLSLPFTPQLSLYSKPWRSFTLSFTIEAPPPRRRTPEIDADELHHLIFFLGARSFPKLHLHLLPLLPQASSKKDDLELHQALYTILKPLPVFHSSPVSLSHPRSTHIAIWKP